MATKLVGYDSGDDSETQEESPVKRPRNEFVESQRGNDEDGRKRQIEADFASEWESFEKLIQDSGSSPTAVPSVSAGGVQLETKVDCLQIPQPSATSCAAAKRVVRPKRTFTEEVDSDQSNARSSSEEGPGGGNRAQKSSVSSGKTSSVSSRSSVNSFKQNVRSMSSDSSDDEEVPKKTSEIAEIQEERHSSDMSCDTSSDDDSDEERHKNPVITSIPLSRPGKSSESVTSESRPTRSSTDSKGERRLSDEKPSKPAEMEDRIRAKLIAIAEQPVTDIRRSRSRSRDRIVSTQRRQSPSLRSGGKSHRDRAAIQHGRNVIRRSRSRSRHRRRSRSREHERRRGRSRSNDRRKRRHDHPQRRGHDRHLSPRRDRARSRDRRRSHSRSPPKPKPQPMNFKEQLKAQVLSVASAAEATAAAAAVATAAADVHKPGFSADAGKPLLTANEKPSHLPLNTTNPLVAAIAAASAYSAVDKVTPQQALAHTMAAIQQKVTPQQALMQTMAAVHQKAQELTGVAVPSYYNPAAVNPLKYAEQLKKRKLLWSKPAKETAEKEKETETKTAHSVAQWTGSSFAADSDGKMAAKFCKLMGIREQDKSLLSDNVDISKLTEDQRKRQAELFEQLDKEYEFARITTHTRRGVGLGFGSSSMPDMP